MANYTFSKSLDDLPQATRPRLHQLGRRCVPSSKIYRETDLQFRAEYFNVLNHTFLSKPETRTTNPNFGTIQSFAGTPYQGIVSNVGPRIAQFALKYTF